MALGHLVDTLVILAVVVANTAIGFVQEGKAEKAMDAIRRMLASKASVLRVGARRTIDGETLEAAAKASSYPLAFNRRDGYDDSHYIIASLIEDHLRFYTRHSGTAQSQT